MLFRSFTREDIEITILKAPGTLYSKSEDGQITNLYNIEFVNKTFDDISLELKAEAPEGATLSRIGGSGMLVPKEGIGKGLFMIKVPEDLVNTTKLTVSIGVYKEGERMFTSTAKFIGPLKRGSHDQ